MPKSESSISHRCSNCDKVFSSNSHLRRHEIVHIPALAYHQCAYCQRSFARHDVLRRHSKSCLKRGDGEKVASAKPGRRPRMKKTGTSGHDLLESSTARRRTQDAIPKSGITHAISIDDEVPCDGIPSPFLFQYTDPSCDSILSAFPVAEGQPDSSREESDMPESSHTLDMFGLFGIFSDFTIDPAITSQPMPSSTISESVLQSKVDDLRTQLYWYQDNARNNAFLRNVTISVVAANAVFTAHNFDDCINAYFSFFHPQHPFIHRPSFQPDKVNPCLLLAIGFAGSVHCAPRDAALSARIFFDLAEEFIFMHLREVATGQERQSRDALEVVQAAILIMALQTSFNSKAVRRRIRISRHPELVAAVKLLFLSENKIVNPLQPTDPEEFMTHESMIRTIHVMMLMDCMSTFFFNTLPQISLSEMHLRLPCKDELFEQTSIRYSIPNSTDGQDDVQMIPALQDIVARLIQKETPLLSDQLLKVLEPRHLMMAIFALHSIYFAARKSMLLASSTASIRRAMDRWKSLWHAVHNSNQVDDSRSIGFTKHSMDIWWVANKVVDLVNDEEARSGYLLGIATDSLEDLHMFLKQYMSK